MQTNIILLSKNTHFSSRIAIEVYYLPYEWRKSAKGELQCVQLDSLLNINSKHWNFKTQRPTQQFSDKNNWYHHFMIELQLKRAEAAFVELKSLMLEGQMSGHAIEALYMERNHATLIPFLSDMCWKHLDQWNFSARQLSASLGDYTAHFQAYKLMGFFNLNITDWFSDVYTGKALTFDLFLR